jgi:benzoyl-CoA-dihydrodiol lyase
VEVSFQTDPSQYRHWRYDVDGEVAVVTMDVDEEGGLVDGYELKLNSYDLGVDIELYDLVQRLRFEHPEVRAVVMTGGKDRVFCAGANIKMLAGSPHPWKVNFCKFTNETRNGIEDATTHSGQTWIAAINGTCAGGGYELALACDHLILADDNSSTVALPEVPLLAVLPGTGGLTRVTDKRGVRRDRADVFSTLQEGMRGERAVQWRLVDELAPPTELLEHSTRVARERAATSDRPTDARGIALTPLDRTVDGDTIRYPNLTIELDRDERVASFVVHAPRTEQPTTPEGIHEAGAEWWPLALCRELDDAILDLRTNELELGTWVFRTAGDAEAVLAVDDVVAEHGKDWLVREVQLYWQRTLKRLDVTSRSLFAMVEPGSCFVGTLAELLLAADRSYMLEGVFEDPEELAVPVEGEQEPATIRLTAMNDGPYPMPNGLSRLETRFLYDPEGLEAARAALGRPLEAEEAVELGLVTFAFDDIDWEDETRLAIEERASLSPDALVGMEANLRFPGPETLETKIFGRLTAWQNWIFQRPNAAGEEGALRRYGSGRRADFDLRRV